MRNKYSMKILLCFLRYHTFRLIPVFIKVSQYLWLKIYWIVCTTSCSSHRYYLKVDSDFWFWNYFFNADWERGSFENIKDIKNDCFFNFFHFEISINPFFRIFLAIWEIFLLYMRWLKISFIHYPPNSYSCEFGRLL